MKTATLPFLLALPCAVACASTPASPPEEAAPAIVALLEAGKVAEAEHLFESGADDPGQRDALYPLLYEQARKRFENGDARSSAAILRLMLRGYPKSTAVREAFAYALFLERAAGAKPDPELVEELGKVVAGLQPEDTKDAPWVELARAQQAIDRGENGAAREALARFQSTVKDTPTEITLYAEDIDRYLRSHP